MKTKITFEKESDTEILIKRNGETIGQIWSEQKGSLDLPYPHSDTDYCKNSIQICGYDRLEGSWACGVFDGKRDCVVHFIPVSEYTEEQKKRYAEYVESFFTTRNVHPQGIQPFNIVEPKKDVDFGQLKNFNDWFFHDGHPRHAKEVKK
jgi:hypothetical protein